MPPRRLGTPENAARALDLYNALADDNAAEDPPSDGLLLSIQPEHGVGTQLWMRDDVTGDPRHVIQFVKRCATEFRLTTMGPSIRKQLFQAENRRLRRCAHVTGLATGETVDWIYTDGWLSSVWKRSYAWDHRNHRLSAGGELSDAAKDKARAWYH